MRKVCKPMNSMQSRQDHGVKIAIINCNWSITLCDNYNQSVIPCGPDVVSIKSWTGPMRVFCSFAKGYINQNTHHWGMSCLETWLVGKLVE